MRSYQLLVICLLLLGCGPNRLIEPLSQSESQKLVNFEKLDAAHQLQISEPEEPGKPLLLALTFVWKETGQPLKRHFISFYHADSTGNYRPANPDDESTARLSGRAMTNELGQIFVSTVLPGDYGSSEDNRHIHTSVYGANPVGYDIHFKQYTGRMGENFIDGSDQHFLADLKSRNNQLVTFQTIEVKNNERSDDVIAFNSSRNGNGDLFLMNENGQLIQQLTVSSADQWSPRWSGRNQIDYLEQTNIGIVRKSINIQSLETAVLPHPAQCILDDKNMLYTPDGEGGFFVCLPDIYSFSANKNDTVNLTSSLSGTSNYPSLSGEGKHMIFTNNQTGNNDVYSLDLVSGEMKNLTVHPANDERGVLSPDGHHVAFSTNRYDRAAQDIVILNLETQEIRKVTEGEGYALISKWSSDGNTLYFGSNDEGDWEIYRYELITAKTVNITRSKGFDGDPQVKPKY